jgi:hypothetical protein
MDSLRTKIQKLMHPQGIEDAKAVEVNGEAIDVGKEMGIEDTPEEAQEAQEAQEVQEVQNTPAETKKDDDSDPKPA